jgi:predicted PurR-regulated permease PerM
MDDLRTEYDRVEALAFYGIVILIAYTLYLLFQPFLQPLGWAGVLAVCCYGWHERLERRWGPTGGAAASTVVVAAAIIIPGVLVIAIAVREAGFALSQLQAMADANSFGPLQTVSDWIYQHLGRTPVPLAILVRQGVAKFSAMIGSQAGTLLVNIAGFLFDLFITLFALFFFFRDGSGIMRALRRALPFEERQRERMIRDSRELISASVTSSLIVASVQGTVGGIVFYILGLGEPVFWGVMMAFFAMLPIGGAFIIWLPAAIWLFSVGRLIAGLVLMALGVTIISGVDNLLRPALLSGRSELHGLLLFIALLGGVAAWGLLGIVLGPVVLAVAVVLFEAYTNFSPARYTT